MAVGRVYGLRATRSVIVENEEVNDGTHRAGSGLYPSLLDRLVYASLG